MTVCDPFQQIIDDIVYSHEHVILTGVSAEQCQALVDAINVAGEPCSLVDGTNTEGTIVAYISDETVNWTTEVLLTAKASRESGRVIVGLPRPIDNVAQLQRWLTNSIHLNCECEYDSSTRLAIDIVPCNTHGAKNAFAVDLRLDKDVPSILAQHSGTIYVQCTTRKNAEKLAKQLKPLTGDVAYYHAGMSAADRKKLEQQPRRVTVGTSWPTWHVDVLILKGLLKYNGKERRYEALQADELASFKTRLDRRQLCRRLVVMCEQGDVKRTESALLCHHSELKSELGAHVDEAIIHGVMTAGSTDWLDHTLWRIQHPLYDFAMHIQNMTASRAIWKEDAVFKTSLTNQRLLKHCLPIHTDIASLKGTHMALGQDMIRQVAKVIVPAMDIQVAFGDKKTMNELRLLLGVKSQDQSPVEKVSIWILAMYQHLQWDSAVSFRVQQEANAFNDFCLRLCRCMLDELAGSSASLPWVELLAVSTTKTWPWGPASLQRQVPGIGAALSQALCDHRINSPQKLRDCSAERIELICRQYAPFGRRVLDCLPTLTIKKGAWTSTATPVWLYTERGPIGKLERVDKRSGKLDPTVTYAKLLPESYCGISLDLHEQHTHLHEHHAIDVEPLAISQPPTRIPLIPPESLSWFQQFRNRNQQVSERKAMLKVQVYYPKN